MSVSKIRGKNTNPKPNLLPFSAKQTLGITNTPHLLAYYISILLQSFLGPLSFDDFLFFSSLCLLSVFFLLFIDLRMGPIRGGFKRRKKAEKKVDQNVLAAASDPSLFMLKPHHQPFVDSSSTKITGPLSESRNSKKFGFMLKISSKTFDYIYSLVKDDARIKHANFTRTNGKLVSVSDQVAIALRRLSTGESLSTIGDSLSLNQSSVSQITWRFVEAMEERGMHHLCWPSTEAEMDEIKSKFEKICGLPNCCGAIDTTHIVMTLPMVDHSNDVWIDGERNHSMILQAIVDPDMRFRDVIVGYPGSLSNAVVLQNSRFFKLCEEGKRLNGKKKELRTGIELGDYIVGDTGFPLLTWLLTPYQDALLNHQAEFNKRHSATHMVSQIALARLKEMWKIIHGVMWLPDKNKLPRIAFVCCLLHNIVIDMEDEVLHEMPLSHYHDTNYPQQICGSVTEDGAVMREKLSLSCQQLPPFVFSS